MNTLKYSLDTRRGKEYKHICPQCNQRTFTRYVNNSTFAHIADNVGRCDREIKCQYHYPPRTYFADHPWNQEEYRPQKDAVSKKSTIPTAENLVFCLDVKYLHKSIENEENSNFIKWLYKLIAGNPKYGKDVFEATVKKYALGGSGKIKDAVVFWQIDTHGQVRTGKIMQYNPETGKRIKDPDNPNKITWVHYILTKSKLVDENFKLQQCFFGEHLLPQFPAAIVGVFESEKTAILASILYPQMVCIATGGLQGLNKEKCKVLRGRRTIFFPDTDGYTKWKKKATAIAKEVYFAFYSVDDTLERNASEEEKKQGVDLGDYIVQELTN
jgi:hypothetical protein